MEQSHYNLCINLYICFEYKHDMVYKYMLFSSHLSSKWFSTTTCLCRIRVFKWKASSNKCITKVKLHPEYEEKTLRITNCTQVHKNKIKRLVKCAYAMIFHFLPIYVIIYAAICQYLVITYNHSKELYIKKKWNWML